MEGIGNSGGEGGQKKNKITEFVWKKNGSSGGEGVHLQIPSVVGYGYFLELHNLEGFTIHFVFSRIWLNLK